MECGEIFVDSKTGDKNIMQVHNQYREKYKLLFPVEIIELREKYGLTKAKMSLVLGWGQNTYANYEKGALQNESHNSLMRLVEDPEQFFKLVEMRFDLFSSGEIEILRKRIEKTSRAKKELQWIDLLWPRRIGSDTGYVKPNLNKFVNMVLYFLEKEKPYKTKLNKLLFYSDFYFFREYIKAISGSRYRAIAHGPVPSEYDAIYDWMRKNKFIDVKEKIETCGVTERFEALIEFDKSVFEKSEFEMLNNVQSKFKDFNATDIKKYSHKENAWKENEKEKKIINYQKYGFSMI
jgi:putative zinc finger/helix-turn-helix YgiT family protein